MSQTQITSALVRARVNELRTQNAQLKTQIQLLEETEQSLNAKWEGDARVAFHNAFESDKAQMLAFYSEMERYIQVLESMAARYEQAEQLNVQTANMRKA